MRFDYFSHATHPPSPRVTLTTTVFFEIIQVSQRMIASDDE